MASDGSSSTGLQTWFQSLRESNRTTLAATEMHASLITEKSNPNDRRLVRNSSHRVNLATHPTKDCICEGLHKWPRAWAATGCGTVGVLTSELINIPVRLSGAKVQHQLQLDLFGFIFGALAAHHIGLKCILPASTVCEFLTRFCHRCKQCAYDCCHFPRAACEDCAHRRRVVVRHIRRSGWKFVMYVSVFALVHFSIMACGLLFYRYMMFKSAAERESVNWDDLQTFRQRYGDIIPLLALVFALCWAYALHRSRVALERWWRRRRPEAEQGATSLADFHEVYGATFITVSLPERGQDCKQDNGLYRFGSNPRGAPVMDIIEELPLHLRKNVVFLNAVDFAGSTSSDLCGKRIRWANPEDPEQSFELAAALEARRHMDPEGSSSRSGRQGGFSNKSDREDYPATSGNVVYCRNDFEREDLRRVPEFKHLEPKEYKEKCIEHSQWITFWSGQVSGGVKAALANIREVGFPSREVQRASNLPTFREASMWEDPSYWTMAVSTLKEFLPIRGTGKLRTLVVLTVDGGPITQVEKRHIPHLVQNALSDLRSRHYKWTAHARIVWAHFPTVEDLIHSFDGVQNLIHDDSEHNQFATDCYGKTLTFKWAGDPAQEPAHQAFNKSYAFSLLQPGGVARLLSLYISCQDENANVVGFRSAIAANDVHTVNFIANRFKGDSRRKAVNGALSHRFDRGPQHPSLQAASHGSFEVLELLLELRADITAHDPEGRGALHHAVMGHRPSLQVVEKLVKEMSGADVQRRSADGRTPLEAAEHAHPGCDSSSKEGQVIDFLKKFEPQNGSRFDLSGP